MEKLLNNNVVEETLALRLPITKEIQRCSFILPDGKFIKMTEHYEAFKFLVIEQLVQCIPDAEQLLSELGYLRYSDIGYFTLPEKELTKEQYESFEDMLNYISRYKDSISGQIANDPKFYVDYDLSDIPHIIERVKLYYNMKGTLLP